MSPKCIDREGLERRRTCGRFINQPTLGCTTHGYKFGMAYWNHFVHALTSRLTKFEFKFTSNKEFCAFFVSFQQTNSISVFLKGVSSALSVLFVFPVQALTDAFNYTFHCSVKTKVFLFFIYNFNILLTILKLPVIYHASLHCSLFAKNTKQAAHLTIIESRNESAIWKNTFCVKS